MGALRRVCIPDPDFAAGRVSSIYYDTPDWQLLGEKRNSDYLKTKVRLRWYESLGEDSAPENGSFLEVKLRVGCTRRKVRVASPFSAQQLRRKNLSHPDLVQVLGLLAVEGLPYEGRLRPAFVVSYCRHRFFERSSGARISIDSNITAPRVNPQMLGSTQPCRLPETIVEIKGADDALPVGLRHLLALRIRRASFSKYYQCYGRLTATQF